MINFTNSLLLYKFNNKKSNDIVLNKCQKNAFNAHNLAPLKQDTVSFCGVVEYKAALNNKAVCEKLHNGAKPAQTYMCDMLRDIYIEKDENGDFKKDKNGNVVYIDGIKTIKGRTKSADSIQEKIADKIEEALTSKQVAAKIFSPIDDSAIKERLRDIVGARIVIDDDDDKKMSNILSKFGAYIKENGIIVDEIQNHTAKNSSIPQYFSKKDLDEFKNVVNEVRRKNGLEDIEVINKPKELGYMALHVGVDLSDIGDLASQRGYHGEIQILGADVELLKDVEDLCYKLKDGKTIKAGDVAFEPFAQMFNNAFKTGKKTVDEKRVKAFAKYTRKAFEAQRIRRRTEHIYDDVTNWAYIFPTLEDCGVADVLPPILDFNILARIYRDIDDIYKVEHNTEALRQEMINKVNSPSKKTEA